VITLNENEKKDIQRIIDHCSMLKDAFMHPELQNLAEQDVSIDDLRTFTQIQLIGTMFLVYDNEEERESVPMGGFLYRILKPLDLEHLLDSIRNILSQSIGPLTFEEFAREQRDKLTTHGDLSFESMSEAAKAVPRLEAAVKRWQEVMNELLEAVTELQDELADAI